MRFAKKALAYILVSSLYLCSLQGAGDTGSLALAETQISRLFTSMASAKADADKQRINDSIVRLMDVALQTAGSMEYPFSRLDKMGKISSGDSKIRIYTWNLPWSDGTNTYFGYLQYETNNRGEIKQVFLNDKSADMPDASMSILSPSQWYGMLIYEIIDTKYGGKVYYTLLGLDNRDLFVSCKIADVLLF